MQFLKQVFLPLGLFMCICGLGLQILVPMQVSPNAVNQTSPTTVIESLHVPQAFGKNSTLYLDLTITTDAPQNISLLLLNETEYGLFINGSLPQNAVLSFPLNSNYYSSQSLLRIQTTFSIPEGKYYFIVMNSDEDPVHIVYYLSHASLCYYYGLVFLMFGLYLILATYIYYETGWKKYFYLGIGINLICFFARAALLNMNFALVTAGNPEIHLEFYSDFQFFYIPWTRLLMQGVSPYSDQMQYYIYPPLFLLTLGLFEFLPLPMWKLALPFLGSIIGTGYIIFRIALSITKNEQSSAKTMLFYFLNPITLFYGSFIWLNPSLYVFFLVLSLYFLIMKKPLHASVILGIATLYKQFALLFFLLILLSNFLKQDSPEELTNLAKLKMIFKSITVFVIPIAIFSLIFYLIDGMNYLSRVLFHLSYSTDYLTRMSYSIGSPVNFNTFFLYMEVPAFFTNAIAWTLRYYVLFGIFYLGFFLFFLFQKTYTKGVPENNPLDWISYYPIIFGGLIISFSLILFYPRGSYKFYLLLLIPFLCLYPNFFNLNLQDTQKSSKKTFIYLQLIFLGLGWLIIFLSRYIYFMFLFALMIFCLIYMNMDLYSKKT